MDSSRYDKSRFPDNYLQDINLKIVDTNYLFVSSHVNVRVALQEKKIPFVLVYPKITLKQEYLIRYKDRNSDTGLISMIDNNWEDFINSCESQRDCIHIQLDSGQYLSDVLKFSIAL